MVDRTAQGPGPVKTATPRERSVGWRKRDLIASRKSFRMERKDLLIRLWTTACFRIIYYIIWHIRPWSYGGHGSDKYHFQQGFMSKQILWKRGPYEWASLMRKGILEMSVTKRGKLLVVVSVVQYENQLLFAYLPLFTIHNHYYTNYARILPPHAIAHMELRSGTLIT